MKKKIISKKDSTVDQVTTINWPESEIKLLKDKVCHLSNELKEYEGLVSGHMLARKHREMEFQSKIKLIYSMYYLGSMIIDELQKEEGFKTKMSKTIEFYELSKRNPLINYAFEEDVRLSTGEITVIKRTPQ